jgi:hypothetical protein
VAFLLHPGYSYPEDVVESTTSPLQLLLTRLWTEVLRREVNDPEADFFELGGRPAEVDALLSLVRERFGVQPPPETLVEGRTVSGFAEALKHYVDHPGKLERMAERLLSPASHPGVSGAVGNNAGGSW